MVPWRFLARLLLAGLATRARSERVALCVLGRIRAAHVTAEAFRRNLLDPLCGGSCRYPRHRPVPGGGRGVGWLGRVSSKGTHGDGGIFNQGSGGGGRLPHETIPTDSSTSPAFESKTWAGILSFQLLWICLQCWRGLACVLLHHVVNF